MKRCCLLVLATLISGSVIAEDRFSWLRDDSRSNERVLDYLEKQNETTDAFQKTLQHEIDSLQSMWRENRPQRSEKPWREIHGVEYVWNDYTLLSRAQGSVNSTPIFDATVHAAQYEFYQIGGWKLSPDNTLLAIAEDLDGSEQYQISIVELATNKITPLVTGVEPSIAWSNDGESLYLVKQEPNTQRPHVLFNKSLKGGTEKLLFQEHESAWLLSTYLASDPSFAIVQSNSENSSEQRFLDLNTGELSQPIQTRQEGIEYYADRFADRVYINSNHQRKNFQIYRVISSDFMNIEAWHDFGDFKADESINNFHLFRSGVVVQTNLQGKQKLHVFDESDKLIKIENVAREGGVAWVSQVGDYQSNQLHIRSMSMVQPGLWERFNTLTATRESIGQDIYPNYQADMYVTQTLNIENDGHAVPVTLAYRKDLLNKQNPVVLYGYGAYGVTMKPYFMPQIISLLDRGVIYAIAHVRGGGFKGEHWYQDGKGINKPTSIADFVAAARTLQHFQQGERAILAMGSSAGGTLVAGALNEAPEVFAGASLKVPFVDVISSMSDETLPLTAQQYAEWGDPHKESELSAMKAYDPYLNLSKADYPPVLISVGLNDRRVPYWEGAKYHAKLQSLTTGNGPYLLSTNFSQGHSSDRRQSLSQQAFEYAFLLSLTHKNTKAEQ
ncbi:prolyl oligopeptidase family serine peptidase [Vibrio fortis]|uniref:prolyl oligopeptidase family serine peptidase n=1 Tax=Vibrio fortis TaxID=212667 RepID=UPI0021C2B2B0|nr:prolyl oligopeptidase family serine peptidase [Vibrio fortis]